MIAARAQSIDASAPLGIVYLAMAEARGAGWRFLAGRSVVLTGLAAIASASGAVTTATAAGTAISPSKVAVVILENKDYDNSLDPTDRRYVVGNPAAPYINGTVIPESLSLVPTPLACDHPAGDAPGIATTPCRSGMFQSYRNELGFRVRASAPEYAWIVTGTDSNVRDSAFPSGLNPNHPEGGIVGYTPGHNDTSGPVYDLFGYMEANGVPFQDFQEDYPGGAADCSTVQFSDQAGTTAMPSFYARKHSPLLLTWSQSPDALVVNDGPGGAPDFSPAVQPGPGACEGHVRNFPGNVPNSTTAVQRNFTGDEPFGRITFVVPSMCHTGHNSDRVCGGTPGDARGGMEGVDRWLQINLDGLRRDVGRNGVVIVTFDENHTSDGAGIVAPIFTAIVPGVNAAGTPGTLTAPGCDPMPAAGCTDTTTVYDHSSTARSLIEVAGGSCAIFDNASLYQGQTTTARQNCAAATPLPLGVVDATP
jgi:hypothetical protein